MPIIASAKKKLRQDKKRTIRNKRVLALVKKTVKEARLHPSVKSVTRAYSTLDVASKKHVIHANKAARLKSSLAGKIKFGTKVRSQKSQTPQVQTRLEAPMTPNK